MKLLLINKFLYPKGGDALSTFSTGALLSMKKNEVIYWGMDHPQNPPYPDRDLFVSEIDYHRPLALGKKFGLSLGIFYSLESKRKVQKLIQREKPDLVHLNNFAHQISPSILDVFRAHGLPAVMTMHDYKLVCPNYLMLWKGKPCERCRHGRYYWCAVRRCTHRSFLKSVVNTAEMYLHHRLLRIYDGIGLFISPSRFLMEKVKEMGFRGEAVHLPNFVDPKAYTPCWSSIEGEICYVGRLSSEKGILTLLEAMKGLPLRLKIIGEGPLRQAIEDKIKRERMENVSLLGYRSGKELEKEIGEASAVVVPSEWYENSPRVIYEAFAMGKPVIGARIGGIPELVEDHRTGLTFEPGNPEDLKEKIRFLSENREAFLEMGRNGRKFIEENFDPDLYYEKLMTLYRKTMKKDA
jgi:glycosyltransferase involved in cell wall biosynthesis